MRIGVDLQCLQVAKTGIKTYVEGLYTALQSYQTRGYEIIPLTRTERLRRHDSLGKIAHHVDSLAWTHLHLPVQAKHHNCDALLCLEYTSPLFFRPCPTAVVFYDTSFWRNPQWYNRWWRLLLKMLTEPAAHRAHRVIVISEFTRQEVHALLHIPLEQIIVAYPAAKHRLTFDTDTLTSILQKWELAPKSFILHVGVLERRKNLPRLIQAFAQLVPEVPAEFKLVLAGQPGPRLDLDDNAQIVRTIEAYNLQDRVVLTGYMTDRELAALYASAALLAFPSLREGFGIPIVEAFQCDLPVVASNIAAIPETAGNAALLVNPYDVEALANAMDCVLNDSQLRSELIARGRERAKVFTWANTAKSVLSAFQNEPTLH